MTIKVPNLGDGIASGTVVSVMVTKGDEVSKDQTVLEIETDKAVVPMPSDSSGKVEEILVKEGDVVSVGQAIATLAGGSAAKASSKSSAETPAPSVANSAPPAVTPLPSAPMTVAPTGTPGQIPIRNANPSASPAVRKIAKQLGLDLTWIPGTGNSGRISVEDLRNYIAYLVSLSVPGAASNSAATEPAPEPSVDFSKWGPVRIEKMANLRQTIAKNLSKSWQTIPRVTQHADVDLTAIMALRKKYKAKYEKAGQKLTVTVFIMRAVVEVLKEFPVFNCSIDENSNEIVYKNYFHLGIAVDTENGLIVPVVRDVDKKSMAELSTNLSEMAEKARQRKVGVEDLKGGTFTISNLGGLGGTYFTPIVNKPEVAILGLGQGSKQLRLNGKSVEEYLSMPISVSYDHRIIDGADGARFVSQLAKTLEAFEEKWLKG